jgi:hypothetical protein
MIVCGRDGGSFGVFLDHDPADFGLTTSSNPQAAQGGAMRTGFTEAWLTDVEDDSYDLSWFNDLPEGDRSAVAVLRDLLANDPDPIDRHFQFAELESRLYRCRDLYDTALDEYDTACQRHDAEMDTICSAFREKWGKVPLLETYKQMAIRQAKEKNWESVLWWTERGLALYAADAAREDAVEDLMRRRNRAKAKLEPTQQTQTPKTSVVAAAVSPDPVDLTDTAGQQSAFEVLTCSSCGGTFERPRVRGRKPRLCPTCRQTTP